MHPILQKIASMEQVPIPAFINNGVRYDNTHWFGNNGLLTESESTIAVNAKGSGGAIVYHIYDGDLSFAAEDVLGATLSLHPHMVAVNPNMSDKWAPYFDADPLLQNVLHNCLSSVKVNDELQYAREIVNWDAAAFFANGSFNNGK